MAVLVGMWFWIPLTLVASDRPRARRRLGWGLRAALAADDRDDVTVRVVAYNLEKGASIRDHGSRTTMVSFAEPVCAAVLRKQTLPHVARGQPLERFLTGDVAFAPVFDLPHPPVEVSEAHGLFLQWVAQLLHDQLVDQEAMPATCEFREVDFAPLDAGESEASRG